MSGSNHQIVNNRVHLNSDSEQGEITREDMDNVVFWYLGISIDDMMSKLMESHNSSRTTLKSIAMSMSNLPLEYQNNGGLKMAVEFVVKFVLKYEEFDKWTIALKMMQTMKNIGRKRTVKVQESAGEMNFFENFHAFVANGIKNKIELREKMNLLQIEISEDDFVGEDKELIRMKVEKLEYFENIMKRTSKTQERLLNLYNFCNTFKVTLNAAKSQILQPQEEPGKDLLGEDPRTQC